MTPPATSSGTCVDGVLAEQSVEAEIDMGLFGGHAVLGGENFGGAGRRNGVRHVEHGGDAAERRRRGAALEVLLVRIAGIAEMHVVVDRAWQHVQAGGVERLARGSASRRRRRPR